MKKQMQEHIKKQRFFIIILIILVLLFLAFIIYLLNQNKELKNLPHNIDIFEIECTENCDNVVPNCDNGNNSDLSKDSNKSNGEGTKPASNNVDKPQKIELNDPGIVMFDNDKIWSKETKINIFKSKYVTTDESEVNPKISPEDGDSYEFVIKNKTNFSIKYNVVFKETNEHNINMKYRLRLGNKYVVGNDNKWVTADELKLYDGLLDSLQEDTYYLDWKWFSSDNDTEIGSLGDAKYSLSISIRAEEVND